MLQTKVFFPRYNYFTLVWDTTLGWSDGCRRRFVFSANHPCSEWVSEWVVVYHPCRVWQRHLVTRVRSWGFPSSRVTFTLDSIYQWALIEFHSIMTVHQSIISVKPTNLSILTNDICKICQYLSTISLFTMACVSRTRHPSKALLTHAPWWPAVESPSPSSWWCTWTRTGHPCSR